MQIKRLKGVKRGYRFEIFNIHIIGIPEKKTQKKQNTSLRLLLKKTFQE